MPSLTKITGYCLSVAFCLLIVSCTPGDSASAAGAKPEVVVRGLLEATNTQDKEQFLSLLTAAARRGMESGGGFSIDEAKFEEFKIGAATEKDGQAEVPVEALQDGAERKLGVLLKREDDRWKVYAIRMSLGDGADMTVDVEQFGSIMGAVAEGLESSFQNAFEEMAQGGSEEEIARNESGVRGLALGQRRGVSRHVAQLSELCG